MNQITFFGSPDHISVCPEKAFAKTFSRRSIRVNRSTSPAPSSAPSMATGLSRQHPRAHFCSHLLPIHSGIFHHFHPNSPVIPPIPLKMKSAIPHPSLRLHPRSFVHPECSFETFHIPTFPLPSAKIPRIPFKFPRNSTNSAKNLASISLAFPIDTRTRKVSAKTLPMICHVSLLRPRDENSNNGMTLNNPNY